MEARQINEGTKRSAADQSYTGALIRKWGEFLEGMPKATPAQRYTLGVAAMLFENQAEWLGGLNEETRQVNVGGFQKFIFPILRRVFPNLLANEIVSVQPMNAPIGAIFYQDLVYGTSKGATAAGAVFPRDFDRDYSSENVNGEILATGDGVNYSGAGAPLASSLGFTPVRPLDATRGYSVIVRELTPAGVVVQEATDDGSNGFTGAAAAGSINYSNGAITAFKFVAMPALGNSIKAFYSYDGEGNSKVPTVGLDIKKCPIEAKARRLKAVWSSEASEDLRALHGQDAESELVGAASQEIGLEIDREVIMDLYQAATGTTGAFDRVPPAGINELDHLRSLITVLSTVSNLIHKKTLRAPANWIVTSPEVSALFQQLQTHGDYRPIWMSGAGSPLNTDVDMPRPLTQHGQFGVYKAGTLSNKWMVYEDPFFPRDKLLIGLKGDSYLNAGYAFAPYIPLQVTPTFYDPTDFTFKKGLRTRYAKKMLRPEYFGSVSIAHL
jgi:hypothetical protein